MKDGKAARTVGVMAVIILLAKFMGLFRETMLAGLYGQGMESDILNTATQIPLLFFDMVLGVAILSTFVPVFNSRLSTQGKDAAMAFADNFITVSATLAMILALLGILFAEPLVRLMTPGYAQIPGKVEETARLLRNLFPSIVFTAVAYVAVGILQSFGEFTIPSLISVVSNGVMVVYLWLFGNRLGLVGVVVSMLIAWALQLVVQLPYLRKFEYRYRFRFDIKDSGLREAGKLAVPVLISSWIQPLCNVINMAFGSSLGDGAVSALNWANKIYIIMVGVFAYAITNFIFPKLSRLSGDGEEECFSQITRLSVGWILFLIGLICGLFLALAEPIIQVVFQRGAFTPEDTATCATALFCYSFGMLGYGVCEVLNKSFYAIRDGKTPMFSSVLGIIVNLGGAFVLTGLMHRGIGGLALSSALSSVSIALCLMIMMNRRRPGVFHLEFIINVGKILVCTAVTFFVAKLVYPMTAVFAGGMIATLFRLCLAALPACVAYIGIAVILRVTETEVLMRKRG